MSRFIYTDYADGNITATTTTSGYPVTNLSDYNPKNVWKATGATATLTVTVANAGTMDYAIFNSNSVDPILARYYNGAALLGSKNMEADNDGNFWADSPGYATATKATFYINSYVGLAYAGVLRAAPAGTQDDPKTFDEDYEDYSLVDLTRNQALDIREKDQVALYSGVWDSTLLTTSGKPRILSWARVASPYPLAIKLLESPYVRFVFGLMKARTSGPIRYDGTTAYREVSFDIREVL